MKFSVGSFIIQIILMIYSFNNYLLFFNALASLKEAFKIIFRVSTSNSSFSFNQFSMAAGLQLRDHVTFQEYVVVFSRVFRRHS